MTGKWLVLQVLNHPFSILIEKERERHRRPSPLFAGSTLGFYGGFQRGIAERAGWWTTCHERGRMMIAGPSMCNNYQQLLFEDGWKSLCIYICHYLHIYIYIKLRFYLSFPGLRALEALEVATFPTLPSSLPKASTIPRRSRRGRPPRLRSGTRRPPRAGRDTPAPRRWKDRPRGFDKGIGHLHHPGESDI